MHFLRPRGGPHLLSPRHVLSHRCGSRWPGVWSDCDPVRQGQVRYGSQLLVELPQFVLSYGGGSCCSALRRTQNEGTHVLSNTHPGDGEERPVDDPTAKGLVITVGWEVTLLANPWRKLQLESEWECACGAIFPGIVLRFAAVWYCQKLTEELRKSAFWEK
jgi:hypothetical protein